MSSSIESGSVRELWRIAFPLMLSSLSMTGMWFVDRMFIGQYSSVSLNAVAASSGFIWAFCFGFEHLTSMGHSFVARFNGAKKYERLGEPVWQMIWFSFVTIPIFALIATFVGPFLFQTGALMEGKREYFMWMMCIAPLYCFLSSLSGFFVGQGKTHVITLLAVIGNLVNVILDPILIFGWWEIPAYGVPGAVVATGIGVSVQVLTLFYLFLRQENRDLRGAARWRVQPKMLWGCVRLGAPLGLFVFFECFAWGTVYTLFDWRGDEFLSVAAISQSLILLFLFFGIGLEQGASAVAGNLMGAGKNEEVYVLFRSGLKLIGVYFFLMVIGITLFGERILSVFVEPQDTSLMAVLKLNLAGIVIHLALEKVHWFVNGILRAAGDSRFIMWSGIITIWGCMVLPTYLAVFYWGINTHSLWMLWVAYSLVTSGVTTWRLLHGRWTASVEKSAQIAM